MLVHPTAPQSAMHFYLISFYIFSSGVLILLKAVGTKCSLDTQPQTTKSRCCIMFQKYRFYYCTINYNQTSWSSAHSVCIQSTFSVICCLNDCLLFARNPHIISMFRRHIQNVNKQCFFTSPIHPHTKKHLAAGTIHSPLLSGCKGRRWKRCPCGWPERPSPSCSPELSPPRYALPVVPPSTPHQGAGCIEPPCPPGRLWAGRSLQTAVMGQWEQERRRRRRDQSRWEGRWREVNSCSINPQKLP